MDINVAIIGSGYMGGGIGQVLALAGAKVALADADAATAQTNLERLLTESKQFEEQGLFPAGATETLTRNLSAAPSLEDAVANASFIEEAVPEKLELKRSILAQISAAARPDAIIGSNTSTISIADMAVAVENPERFLGIHFSNPSPFIPGVEIIPHEGTSEAAVATAVGYVEETGKETAVVKDVTGFVLNRLQYALFHEATQLVEEGVASPDDIDTLVRTTFGFRLPFFGPFAIADMAGLDVYNFCYKSLQSDFPERFATPAILAEKIEAGQLGTKSGGGFLDVPADKLADLIAYRNEAYVKMGQLLKDLGPAPLDPGAAE
ncbi:3-hydroxyacyl-CoA dehydrogenase family protein [Zhihengliuella salsuginis]|uniref:3-hydroxyacyl-CoA dehydrogenase n=1 Tax=Zhihengliuella salsuginis TaxID=578222 RepID=A0ABQ3G9T9_9MICC|nr:3-hydroxyacyl-CoA dehydrogenase family protein [Zhihengliuella salsuginis]GHC99131.1 3-hydroxyacyl-CoA dehydrogenase [Zhihengliuella salsuginis]